MARQVGLLIEIATCLRANNISPIVYNLCGIKWENAAATLIWVECAASGRALAEVI
jgi:hypothetical protein